MQLGEPKVIQEQSVQQEVHAIGTVGAQAARSDCIASKPQSGSVAGLAQDFIGVALTKQVSPVPTGKATRSPKPWAASQGDLAKSTFE